MGEPADYVTQDLLCAAFLVLSRHQPQEIRRNGNGDRADFHFSDSPKLQADLATFYGLQARVEPRAYQEVVRSLRGLTRFGYQSVERQEKRSPDARAAYR